MSREKNIGEMTDVLKRIFGGSFAYKIEYGKYSGYEGHKEVYTRDIAAELTDKGYLKASDVALEAVDDFQRSIRHIFLDMCNGNDYNRLNLLQIDSAIEALFDRKIAELKKKYTESEKDDDNT